MSFCSVPPRRARGDPRLLGLRHVHREDHRRRRVDRHRRRDRAQIDARDTGPPCRPTCRSPPRTDRPRPSAIGSSESQTHQRRHVERRRQPVPTGPDDLLEPPVGVVRRPEPGEHPHRPQLRAVHRRIRPRVYGNCPGNSPSSGPYTGVDRHTRHRLEIGIPQPAPHQTPPATHHVDSSGMGSPPPVYGRHGNERLRCVPLRGHGASRRASTASGDSRSLARAASYPMRTRVSTCR